MSSTSQGYGGFTIVVIVAFVGAILIGLEHSEYHTFLCPYIGSFIHG